MKLNPRPYQHEASAAVLAEFDRGVKSTIAVLPTGTGKTILFAMIGDARPWGRVLILAPRQELVYQAVEKVEWVTGDKPDIEMADQYAPAQAMDLFSSSKYVVGTIQTVSKKRRLERFDWKDFGLVIIDEGHHAPAGSYLRTLDYIRAGNPDIRTLLVTATPDRGDGKPLDAVADSVAYRLEIDQAIYQGWLVPVHQKFAHIRGLDFSKIRTRGGDLDEGELAAMLADDGGEMNHMIAAGMVEAAGQEKTLIFCVNVAHAHNVADIINRMAGKRGAAVAVDGTWDDGRRKAVLGAYRRGEFQYLVNCQLFLEGWDEPTISVVGMARPTKSRALYAQAIGRGLRPLPGVVDRPGDTTAGDDLVNGRSAAIANSDKPRCLVVDLAGNSGRHKLVCTADILGGGFEPQVVEAARKRSLKRKTPADMKELLEEEKEKLIQQAEAAEQRREARKQRLYGQVDMTLVDVDPFGRGPAPAPRDDLFRERQRVASGNQVEFLEKIGVHATGWTFDQAQKVIREHHQRKKLGLASIRQKHLLERMGVEGAAHMGRERASAVLDLARANGGRFPGSPDRQAVAIGVAGQGFRLIWRRPDGKRVYVGPAHASESQAREYGRQLVGG